MSQPICVGIMSREPSKYQDSEFEPEPEPVHAAVAAGASVAQAAGGGEVIPLSAGRGMVANYEKNDLDVPAFLRKRGEAI